MTSQVAIREENSTNVMIQEIENTQNLCKALMKTPHYSKLGEAGIYAIIQKAQSIGMNPIEALNGGMYYVQGKVEMQGQAMLSLIRAKGHSVKMDPKSTNTLVIMHGKRADNGDEWTVEFGIEDAKRAGIYRGQHEKYPKVMCIWRCVSMLGRFLFSDVLKGVYVTGEISEAVAFETPVAYEEPVKEIQNKPVEKISKEQAENLWALIESCSPEYQDNIGKRMQSIGVSSIYDLPLQLHEKLFHAVSKKAEEYKYTKQTEVAV